MAQDHTFLGKRGEQKISDLTMRDLYEIVLARVEYAMKMPSVDPEALAQKACCEVEKKMGIYPNISETAKK